MQTTNYIMYIRIQTQNQLPNSGKNYTFPAKSRAKKLMVTIFWPDKFWGFQEEKKVKGYFIGPIVLLRGGRTSSDVWTNIAQSPTLYSHSLDMQQPIICTLCCYFKLQASRGFPIFGICKSFVSDRWKCDVWRIRFYGPSPVAWLKATSY